jgi:glyceraldehyde 3-phosphate dehydrogenase
LALEDKRREVGVVAVNDLTSPKVLAHLFKYDSVHGIFAGSVEAGENHLIIDGHKIEVTALTDPAALAWGSKKIDLVLECTGIFTDRKDAEKHLAAGAKTVVISAPAKDPDITVAMGINHELIEVKKHRILSNASCTTNCLAPIAKVLHDSFGIVRGLMTTIHSYTNDQRILDLPHKDLRRARAAALSMIPTTTGAAKAVGEVLPALKGKLDGFAMRVPTPNVSVVDLVAELAKDVTVDDINKAMKQAAQGNLKGILQYCDEPLVSVDFNGNRHSSIYDSLSTYVMEKRLVKVLSWYDNEFGFSSRMVDLTAFLATRL